LTRIGRVPPRGAKTANGAGAGAGDPAYTAGQGSMLQAPH